MHAEAAKPPHEHSVIETLQSLILAFVLAMTFRGFVTEGFVIPTGSMAPTLMGRHFLAHSPQTGAAFRVGADTTRGGAAKLDPAADPMLGPSYRINAGTKKTRMGDRILVLKSLYPFSSPDRWDVVVFKNPTNPNGEDGNYIKRLIGLPDESILLIDGDVFVGSAQNAREFEAYEIARKPEHVQRAVWRTIADSDYVPVDPGKLTVPSGGPAPHRKPLWLGDGWETTGRTYVCETADPTTLRWNHRERPLTDWTSYNQRARVPLTYLSDLRIAAAVRPGQDGLKTTFDLNTRNTEFLFTIADGQATVQMTPVGESGVPLKQTTNVGVFKAGEIVNVEFWHVDQSMSLYINGERVAHLDYDWRPLQRLQYTNDLLEEEDYGRLIDRDPVPPQISWRFEGSPVTLQRVKVDRDLYYREDTYSARGRNNPVAPQHEELVRMHSPAFGTHTDKPAVLGPDHYFMCGDNSPASLDSRLWGAPHPLIAEQIDNTPFVVHRSLLLGKAWVVYFPAPYSLSEGGRGLIPDFGRLRFIR